MTVDAPKRVLQVFASLDRGGAEQLVLNWYRSIDRTQLQFDFVVNTRDRPYAHEAEIRSLGGRVYSLPKLSLLGLPSYWRAWRSLLRTHPEWGIVHGHYTTAASIYLLLARLAGRFTIAHGHSAEKKAIKSRLRRLATWPLRWIADYRMACSRTAAEWLFRRRAAEIVPNTIDVAAHRFNRTKRLAIRREFDWADRFVIGHVGRLDEAKNQRFLIYVFRELVEEQPDAVLVLVGEGDFKPLLAAQVKELGLEGRVYFVGARADIPALLSAFDVFVFPSLNEGFGIAALESQVSGLPTLVSDAVPSEVRLTGLISSESLTNPPRHWAKRITSLRTQDFLARQAAADLLVGGEYDSAVASQRISELYLSKYPEALQQRCR